MSRRHSKAIIAVLACLGGLLAGSVSAQAQEWTTVKDPVQVFEQGYIQVVGISGEGQSKYNALRAATVVAQRDLLEIIRGLAVSGETTVKDGMLANDIIRTRVEGYLRGAVKCGERYDSASRSAEVCMRLYIRGKGAAFDIILPLFQDAGVLPKPKFTRPPQLIPKVIGGKEQMVVEPGQPAAEEAKPEQPQTAEPAKPEEKPVEVAKPSEIKEAKCGVIVDLEGLAFKPALANRILAEGGEVIFDPSSVVPSILAERGCGGFTNKLDKAKGLLASWGCSEAMVLKASAVNRSTDAIISKDDAAAIFTHNQKTSFLAQAKVVFVIH